MCSGSSARSVTSGTEVCIRYAISYWAIRALIAGSSVASYSIWCSSREAVEHLAAAGGRDPGWVVEVEHRIGPGAELDALVDRRQEAVAPEPRIERLVDRAAG